MEKEVNEFLKNNQVTFNGDKILRFSNEGDILKFYKKKMPLIITVDNTEEESLNQFIIEISKENDKSVLTVLHSLLVDDMIETNEKVSKSGGKESLPTYILSELREAIGLEPTDDSKDHEIAQWSIQKKLKTYLEWNGVSGMSKTISDLIKFEMLQEVKLMESAFDARDVDGFITTGKIKEFITSKI